MRPEGVKCFAGDLPEPEQKLIWATHYAPAADLFSRNAPGVAWKSKPSWYIVANNDRTVQPERNASWRSGCVQAFTLSTAATSRCCPIRTSSSMLSVKPRMRCGDRPRKPEGASRPTPTPKIRGTQGFGWDSRLGNLAGLMGVLLFDRIALGPTVASTLGRFAYHFWNSARFGITFALGRFNLPVWWAVPCRAAGCQFPRESRGPGIRHWHFRRELWMGLRRSVNEKR
jgi:hypothetical protein